MHGEAQLKNSDGDVIIPSTDYQDSRLIRMRTYVCPETALINCVDYQKYGYHRSNITCDQVMGAGVYGWTDATAALNSYDKKNPTTNQTVLGAMSGFFTGETIWNRNK